MIVVPNTKESNGALNQLVAVLRSFATYMSTVFDLGGRFRVNIETGTLTGVTTVATVTTVGTVSTITGGTITTLTNQSQIGGVPANDQMFALMSMNAYNLRDRITVQ